jgi:hypothetical protein
MNSTSTAERFDLSRVAETVSCLLLLSLVLSSAAGITPALAQSPEHQPPEPRSSDTVPADRCLQGYVWREAFVGDHVCVAPERRASVVEDNATAAERRKPDSADICLRGYVWRLASPQDHVCVTQQARDEAFQDNSLAASRLASFVRPPLTPFARKGVPSPPVKVGCHHFDAGQWKEVACASEEDMRNHFSPLGPLETIQSNPKTIHTRSTRPVFYQYTAPFIWGSVFVEILSNATQATEYDQLVGLDPIPNSYSIQTNTNFFPCRTCSNQWPFAGSNAGDQGWVQFTYQSRLPSRGGILCVVNVDRTVASRSSNSSGYAPLCLFVPANIPLTGPGALEHWAAEVICYVICDASDPNAQCVLTTVAYIPWLGGGGWWSVSAPDLFGLSGNWTQVSGTILGYGGGSSAIFSNATFQIELSAFTCFEQPLSTNGDGVPVFCPPPTNTFESQFEPSATEGLVGLTAEGNNLIDSPVGFFCMSFWSCNYIFKSTAPP